LGLPHGGCELVELVEVDGPQAAAIEASKTKEFADEYAMMVESDKPFERDDALATVEVEGYATSWARGMGLID